MSFVRSILSVRLVSMFALAIALVVLVAPHSGSAARWSYRSTVVHVGTSDYTVSVGLSATDARQVNGPIQIVVSKPAGARAWIVTNDGGYNGRGYSISFAGGAAAGTVSVTAVIPSRTTVSAEVDLSSAAGGALGAPTMTNTWVSLQTYQ